MLAVETGIVQLSAGTAVDVNTILPEVVFSSAKEVVLKMNSAAIAAPIDRMFFFIITIDFIVITIYNAVS
jgi:hypothetical protein